MEKINKLKVKFKKEKIDGYLGYSINKSLMTNYLEKLKIQN